MTLDQAPAPAGTPGLPQHSTAGSTPGSASTPGSPGTHGSPGSSGTSGRHSTVGPARVRREHLRSGLRADWTRHLDRPGPEPRRSRHLAHVGSVVAVLAIVVYLWWRITFTLPAGGIDLVAAWVLIAFEAFPLLALTIRTVTLWDIDSRTPRHVSELDEVPTTVVMIPTYNEPAEVVAPTIAAACALEPAHQTWVLDDGDRPWLAEICAAYGARYVTREVHDHAKAGNLNHALAMLRAEEAEGADPVEVIAVLDCDHVPLPTFLTDTLGWFEDPEVALVQGPQAYYNTGAFDDDGASGEQGLFFNVLMPARNHDGAGPFWCGSTSLLRARALHEVGGVSTATIVEDMHTTLELIRAGWKTVYHHQTLALGLAPDTAEQYLLQRRRWGMGSMQVLTRERLWAAKRWLSWRNYYEYLSGTLWWLEGLATVGLFLVPAAVMISGAQTSTAGPLAFATAFVAMFVVRLWGVKRMMRGEIRLGTALALRLLRVPVGLSCAWWLLTRRELGFAVTPKSGADERVRGRVPTVLWWLTVSVGGLLTYAAAGLAGLVPWRSTPEATAASASWLVVALVAIVLGLRRITRQDYATSRRNAHRFSVPTDVVLDAAPAQLVDLSLGGAAVRGATGLVSPGDVVTMALPGAEPRPYDVVRVSGAGADRVLSLRNRAGDWETMRTVALWLFHTPPGAVPALPAGVPAVAALDDDPEGAGDGRG